MLSNKHLALIGVVAFFMFAIISVPAHLVAGWVLSGTGVRYSAVDGSSTNLTLKNASIHGLPVGDVQIKPDLVASLFSGVAADVRVSGTNVSGQFSVKAGDHFELSSLALVSETTSRVGTFSLSGPMSVRSDRLVFTRNGACVEGQGIVRAGILERVMQTLGGRASALEGTLTCIDGNIQVTMQTENSAFIVDVAASLVSSQKVLGLLSLKQKQSAGGQDSLNSALEFAGLERTEEGWRGQIELELF